jgi:dTMP kinase
VSPLFIAIEGPNGVGKTTVAGLVAAQLAQRDGRSVHLTTEPTRTRLGDLLRSEDAGMSGRAFALAIAADRYLHLDTEITPILETGAHVVTDRYVQSSLVLQRIDGLTLAEVWQYNQHVLPPTLSVYLEHDSDEIRRRLLARPSRSRLERAGSPELELELYRNAYDFLAAEGWQQVSVDCRNKEPDAVAHVVIRLLDICTG